ncbi:TylF/MycF/NovP-related O-methyltransferase [Arsukibacterium indicum]|uniref:TylF/MycF family methyltransferase n=1 Tax=Arsukibacterium indicum TaxID=2848612 RepID=A0ABS6MGE1_9GAMM|nr:TylF/MycF/NovP-related O-methyltransferase [Arsukibacterium indicum]MBV2127878.1 TylF/MycF family methyltransferase [Arsukibacterium indicum]
MKLFNFDTDLAFDYENGFYLTSEQKRLQKLVAHYELYKKITGLPGAVLELGVFKGASLLRFATFRDMLEAANSRAIIGFDAFGRFPTPDEQAATDLAFIAKFESIAGNGISQAELQQCLDYKGIVNTQLIAGDIMETLPDYISQHPELRLALLHIDVDVYAPSKLALDLLYKHVVPGGLIIFDDYGTVEGETLAVDEFVAEHKLKLKKLSCSHIPTYIEKAG